MPNFLSLKRHPVNVIIMEKRANGVEPKFDKGLRYRDKKGNYWYHLKKGNLHIKPTGYDKVTNVLGKNWLFLHCDQPGIYLPYNFGISSAEVINQDVLYWFGLQMTESYDMYKADDRWRRVEPVILMGGVVMALFIIFMMLRTEVIKPLHQIAELLQGGISNLRPT